MNFLEEIARTDFQNLLIKSKKTKIHLVINSGNKTTTVFLFQEGISLPFGVLRISTGMNNVEKEFSILKIITKEDEHFSKTIPHPYNLYSFGKQKIASFSFMRGDPMIPRVNKRSFVKDHFQRVRKWLVRLTNIPTPDFLIEESSSCDLSLRCDCVLENIKSSNHSLISTLEQIKSIEKLLKERSIPLVINHNDLHWSNIFLIEDQIGIVDWEATASRWPVIEWFFFIFTYVEKFFSCNKQVPEVRFKVMHEIFFNKNWLSETALFETFKLLKDLSLDEKLIYKFYLLGIFDYAYRRFWYDRSMVNRATSLFKKEGNFFYESIFAI